jgi:hypothetical protein
VKSPAYARFNDVNDEGNLHFAPARLDNGAAAFVDDSTSGNAASGKRGGKPPGLVES